MKTASIFFLNGIMIPSLMYCLMTLLLSKNAWAFQASTITSQQRRRPYAFPGAGGRISRFRERPLWYSSPKSDGNNNEDPKVDSKTARKPNGLNNKASTGTVKDSRQNSQSPLNIFQQILEHFSLTSKVVLEDSQPDASKSSQAQNITSEETSTRKKIVMPKQITTTTEKTQTKTSKMKPEISSNSISSDASTPAPIITIRKEDDTIVKDTEKTKRKGSTLITEVDTLIKEVDAIIKEVDTIIEDAEKTKVSSTSKSDDVSSAPASMMKEEETVVKNITKTKAKTSKMKEKASSTIESRDAPLAPLPTIQIQNKTITKNDTGTPSNDFQQRLLGASLAQRKKQQVKQEEPPCNTVSSNVVGLGAITKNDAGAPSNDFQQRLLRASLAQRNKKQVKQERPPSNAVSRSAIKYQKSVKHIRVLTELYNNSTKSNKKGRKEWRTSTEIGRKTDDRTRIARKQKNAAKRKKGNTVTTAKNLRREQVGTKQVHDGKQQGTSKSTLRPSSSHTKSRRLKHSSLSQQRLLDARLRFEKKARDLATDAKRQQEALICQQKFEESQRNQYQLHRRLLEKKNMYEKQAIQRERMMLFLLGRLTQEKKHMEAKNKRDVLFHQRLLAARYQYVERAKTFQMRRLAQEIIQQKEEQQKRNEYQFQSRRLAASIQSMKKQREKEKQDKLNLMLQDSNLINYTKKKIAQKSKLIEASIENERIARRQQKKKEEDKQKSALQEALMEERLRSQTKAAEAALKRAAEARAETVAAAEKRRRQKQLSEFQQELLSARIRYELVERKRLAEKRINELHQSLLNAQRESELAAAQVLEAEERKRQAQLELEERQKQEEEEEERKRQAQLELEERKNREAEEKDREAKRIEAEQRVQQQIKESKEKEEALRRDFENAGRQQATTDTDPSAGGMNEYEAILEIQRKQAVQRRIDEGKRRQEELQRMLENAGRGEASEQTTMDRYDEILQQQKNEEMQRKKEEAQRRQENLQRQLEEAGRAISQEGVNSMDKYSQWVEQANKTSLVLPDPSQPSPVRGVIQSQSENVMIENFPSATLQPDLASPPEEAQQLKQQDVDSLVGKVLLDKFFIAEKLRVGGDRSELYKCYHVLDKPQQYALVIKLSHNIQQIELEHRIYGDLFSRLSQDRQELFVRAYDWVPASDLTNARVGFAMECGLENLRGHIWRHGPYTGEKLRNAMENVIRIVQALHGLGVVWSELKAENFIVFPGDKIKAVDLESVAAHNEFLRAYTAETYPPEFPADSLYQCLPQIPVDYSFDVWGMGLTLYELAVGEPLFTLQRTYDVDYIKERLKNPHGIVDEANKKMWKVESGARNIIRNCLVVDPTKRSSCDELLQDPYFTNGNQSRPPAFSPTAMGSSSFR